MGAYPGLPGPALIVTLGEETKSSGNKRGNKKVEGEEGAWGKSKQKVEKGQAEGVRRSQAGV